MNKQLLFLLLASFVFFSSHAQQGSYDQSFNAVYHKYGDASGPDGNVRCILPLGDGRMMISGWFAFYNGTYIQRICRINSDGSLDNSFNPGVGANAVVQSMALQSDGKIIAVGDFTSYNTTAVNRIIRINSDGSLDNSFSADANALIRSVAVQPDGKILVAGSFTSVNGSARNYIARLSSSGSLDNSFNGLASVNNAINTMILKTDGRILIGGSFDTVNNTSSKYLARLNSDGRLDTNFNTSNGANGDVLSMVEQADGKIVIGGFFNMYGASNRIHLARIDSVGMLDNSFNPGSGTNAEVLSLALQADGKIIAGGSFTTYDIYTQNRLMRLSSDGSLDLSFNSLNGITGGSSSYVSAIAILSDGKIMVGGDFAQYAITQKRCLIKIFANGYVDTDFIPSNGTNGKVYDIDRMSSGKIFIAGDFSQYNSTSAYCIARLNADGSFDYAYNTGYGFNGVVRDILVQPDGKLVAAGGFNLYNGIYSPKLVRLKDNGDFDSSFATGSGANGEVFKILLLSNNRILVCGNFTAFNGQNYNRLIVLNTDGSVDTSFHVGSGLNGNVKAACLQADGKILLGGSFSSYNGNSVANILRLNADGSTDQNFATWGGSNNTIHAIVVQADGKILVGGAFTTYNGGSYDKMLRLNSNGIADNTFATLSGTNGSVEDIAIQADGKILVTGDFLTFNSSSVNRITRLNPSGSFDYFFSSGGGINAIGRKLFVLPDMRTLIGGDFIKYGGNFTGGIARLNNEKSIAVPSFGASLCKGGKVNIPFLANGVYDTSNIFTAQLSDVNGNFGSPIDLGSVKAVQSTIILATIPNSVSTGTAYRVRIVSSAPFVEGSDNGINLAVNNCNSAFITNLSSVAWCPGDTFTVNYETTGSFNSSNIFTVQLSDTNGNFANSLGIGSSAAITNGHIGVQIPLGTQAGARYRVRLVSTDPVTASVNNNYDLVLKQAPTVSISSGVKTSFCLGDSTLLSSSGTYINKYQWRANNVMSSNADTFPELYAKYAGSYTLKVFAPGGCSKISNSIAISTNAPNQAIFNSNNTAQCLAGNNFAFTDMSNAGSLSGRLWSFGDGVTRANDSLASHNFASPGLYNVRLTIIFHNGCIDTFNRLITVNPHPKTVLKVDNTAQCFNTNSFAFDDSSTISSGSISRIWYFGDNQNSNLKSLIKNYGSAGTYNVKLKSVSDAGCADSAGKVVQVFANPVADYTINEANHCFANNYFILTDKSTISSGTVSLITWQIPGIGQSIASVVGVSFTTIGNQAVKLVARSDKGCLDSITKNMLVRQNPAKPVIGFSGPFLVASYGSGYQWYVNDTSIGGAFFQQYRPLKAGYYKVRVDSSNGCANFSDQLLVSKAGIAEAIRKGNLKIYPNPVQHTLTIAGEENFDLEIVDITGKLLLQHSKQEFEVNIDLSGLQSGVYVLRIADPAGVYHHKFIRE